MPLQGLDTHLRRREAADYRAHGPGGGGFCRAPFDAAAAGLAVGWPGVRHALVPDAVAAAEHIVGLTKALAVQPYKVQVPRALDKWRRYLQGLCAQSHWLVGQALA